MLFVVPAVALVIGGCASSTAVAGTRCGRLGAHLVGTQLGPDRISLVQRARVERIEHGERIEHTDRPAVLGSSVSVPPVSPLHEICPAGVYQPFCFRVPAGFQNYSYLTTYGKGWMYRTLVSVGRHDLIEVLASRERTSTDTLSNTALRKYYDRTLRARRGRYSVHRAGSVHRVRVDGARAFEQHSVFVDGVHGDTTTVFRGRSIISISCQSQTLAGKVHTGCASIHRSLVIR